MRFKKKNLYLEIDKNLFIYVLDCKKLISKKVPLFHIKYKYSNQCANSWSNGDANGKKIILGILNNHLKWV